MNLLTTNLLIGPCVDHDWVNATKNVSGLPKPPSDTSISHGDPQFKGPFFEAADEDYRKTVHVRGILLSHLILSSLTERPNLISKATPSSCSNH